MPDLLDDAPWRPAGARRPGTGSRRARGAPVAVLAVLLLMASIPQAAARTPPGGAATEAAARITIPSLDGRGNNVARPDRGRSGRPYRRFAPADYADGVGAMAGGPSPRYISNRVFNDSGVNLFSPRGVSQWVWVWGQFVDHTLGLARRGDAVTALAFDDADPLEEFTNDFGAIDFARDAAASGAGTRQQVNTISSYLDAWNVYGGSAERLEWLREGPVDANPANNGPHLLLDENGLLPRRDERGDPASAPAMDLPGRLRARGADAVVAGDVRANENIALTAVHTLFAREHNRLVDLLPPSLSAQRRFDLARRVVMAELQYITYREFLPAVGVVLPPYRGYDPGVNTTITNEFATVGFRAHSMVHGAFETRVGVGALTEADRAALQAQGVTVADDGDHWLLSIPLHVAFGNPGLVEQVGLDAVLAGLGQQRQYANDEQIDNQLRSVLFQVPGPDVTDPTTQCQDQDDLSRCFTGVVDLAAIDVARARDHGIPRYNDLRAAYALPRVTSFTQLTGEATDQFPDDPEIDADDPLDDPDILDVLQVETVGGHATRAIRRTTLAARLRAIYGSVDEVDAFVAMLAEPHGADSELGPLQVAIWRQQFAALRDGDRFFHANRDDRSLRTIRERFGIDYRVTLSEVVQANTGLGPGDVAADVFRVAS